MNLDDSDDEVAPVSGSYSALPARLNPAAGGKRSLNRVVSAPVSMPSSSSSSGGPFVASPNIFLKVRPDHSSARATKRARKSLDE